MKAREGKENVAAIFMYEMKHRPRKAPQKTKSWLLPTISAWRQHDCTGGKDLEGSVMASTRRMIGRKATRNLNQNSW
jgi:hypothetical protein